MASESLQIVIWTHNTHDDCLQFWLDSLQTITLWILQQTQTTTFYTTLIGASISIRPVTKLCDIQIVITRYKIFGMVKFTQEFQEPLRYLLEDHCV